MNIKTHVYIERKISTGQYENILIRLDMETDISADNIDELNKKFDYFRNQFIEKYQDTQTKVMKELGVEEKSAFINTNVQNVPAKIHKLNEMDLKEVFND